MNGKSYQLGNRIDWINNTGVDVINKTVVPLKTRIGIALGNIANGAEGVLHVSDVWPLTAIVGTAFAVGDQLFWDAVNKHVTTEQGVVTGVPVPDAGNTGDGTVTDTLTKANAEVEVWALKCKQAPTNSTVFMVQGSKSGPWENAALGAAYNNGKIEFTINDGEVDFALGDKFTIAQTMSIETSEPVPDAGNTGDGTITGTTTGVNAEEEIWTLTCTQAVVDGGVFEVKGSKSGPWGNATVGTVFDNGKIAFTINDGATDFAVGDVFTIEQTSSIESGVPVPDAGNTGNGTVTDVVSGANAEEETWTLICIQVPSNTVVFEVEGSKSGTWGDATAGVAYNNGKIAFTINNGVTGFVVGDKFTIAQTASNTPAGWCIEAKDAAQDWAAVKIG